MIFKKKENKNIIESLLEEPNKEDNVDFLGKKRNFYFSQIIIF